MMVLVRAIWYVARLIFFSPLIFLVIAVGLLDASFQALIKKRYTLKEGVGLVLDYLGWCFSMDMLEIRFGKI